MDLVRAIREVAGVQASDRPSDKLFYARDLLPRHHIAVRDGLPTGRGERPAAIAWPETTDEVAKLVRLCRQEGVKVVPFGAGSGVCGGIAPDAQSLIIDTKRMKRWRDFAPADGFLEVEAGAMGIRLEEDLQAEGHSIGHFPSSILCSTVGGWVAARGAGQCSGLYGKIEDMVASLEMVDGRGEVATLQRRLTGPDLLPLVIGSEGVFGVITSARLRLHPVPAHRGFAAFSFERMEDGWDTLREAFQMGLRPAVSRLYDPFDSMIAKRGKGNAKKQKKARGGPFEQVEAFAVRHLLRLPGPLNAAIDTLGEHVFGGATMVLVFEGSAERVADELEAMRVLCRERGAETLGEEPARHWLENRYSVSYKQAPMIMKGAFVDTMEVAAPWSKLGQLYDDVRAALGRHALVMAHMSHAYPDGCSIYFTFAGSAPEAADAEAIYDAAWRDALDAAIGAGGTLSHHHGVGRTKAGWLGRELRGALPTLRAIKHAFDPDGILNPGNLIPDGEVEVAPSPAAPTSPVVSTMDGLVNVSADHTLGQIETALERDGLTLGLEHGLEPTERVGSWVDRGLPGAPDPWLDPVDHVVSGFTARTPTGDSIEVPPCPRRAAGPDLWALFAGTHGRAGTVESLHLRARGRRRAASLTTPLARQPEPEPGEQRWIDRILSAVEA